MNMIIVQCQSWLSVLQDDFLQDLPGDILLNHFVHLFHAGSSLLGARTPGNVLAADCLQWLRVLGGDDNGGFSLARRIDPLAERTRHLRLAVRAQTPQVTTLSSSRHFLSLTGCHRVRQRHGVLGLITRVTEYDTWLPAPTSMSSLFKPLLSTLLKSSTKELKPMLSQHLTRRFRCRICHQW